MQATELIASLFSNDVLPAVPLGVQVNIPISAVFPVQPALALLPHHVLLPLFHGSQLLCF